MVLTTFGPPEALMLHHAIAAKEATAPELADHLIQDYVAACATLRGDLVASQLHSGFAKAISSSRELLYKHRVARGSADGAEAAIIRPEWGKDFLRRLADSWNTQMNELRTLVTELAAVWVATSTSGQSFAGLPLTGGGGVQSGSQHFENVRTLSQSTIYVGKVGVVLQKWPYYKEAKNYVNSLHAIVNAPLSPYFAPYAVAVEVLGVTVVGFTVIPVSAVQHPKSHGYLQSALEACCANLRLFPTVASANEDGSAASTAGGSANGGNDMAALTAAIGNLPRLLFGFGRDARWYAVDVRDMAQLGTRQVFSPKAGRFPRRELIFGPSGLCTSTIAPEPFVAAYRQRGLIEQLLTMATPAAAVNGVSQSLSGVIHTMGVNFGLHISLVYFTMSEQEKLFLATAGQSRKTPAIVAQQQGRMKKFALCKTIILSELVARVTKRFIREHWRRCATSDTFIRLLRGVMLRAADPDSSEGVSDETIAELNAPFIDCANAILRHMFGATGQLHPDFVEDLQFIINDIYVKSIFATGKAPGSMVLDASLIDPERVAYCLGEALDVNIQFHPTTSSSGSSASSAAALAIDAGSNNLFEQFFVVDYVGSSALRSKVVSVTIDMPTCLSTGMRSKLQDFVGLQRRLALKLQQGASSDSGGGRTSSVSQDDVSAWAARYISLYATDVAIAYTGQLTTSDYQDVLQPLGGNVKAALRRMLHLEILVASRRVWLTAFPEPVTALKLASRFQELSRLALEKPSDAPYFAALRAALLLRVSETLPTFTMLEALDGALEDLNNHCNFQGNTSSTNASAANATKGLSSSASASASKPSSATAGGEAGNGQPQTTTNSSGAIINEVGCNWLFLPLLSTLVRIALRVQNPVHTKSDMTALAIRYGSLRRDVIVRVHGENSVEAGVACNDVASISSGNMFDLDRAEAEFERAVIILRAAQPNGSALFITENNLAFLYFRKAEKLRQALVDGIESGTKPNVAHLRAKIKSLVENAETLLDHVLSHEGAVHPAEFAAACNNLGSIHLFRHQLTKARSQFQRALDVTETMAQESQAELPCRVHATKNMKVINRRLYMNAVMRIQILVRRFAMKLRNRKAVLRAGAGKLLQRVARGYAQRMAAARRFRFSGFYFWMRIPRFMTLKLDPTFRPLPVDVRRDAFWLLVQDCLRRVQRVGRAMSQRSSIGRVYSYHEFVFRKKLPELMRIQDEERLLLTAGGALSIYAQSLGDVMFADHMALLFKELQYRAHVDRKDVERGEFFWRSDLIVQREAMDRLLIVGQRQSWRSDVASYQERFMHEELEWHARSLLLRNLFLEKRLFARNLVMAEEQWEFSSSVESRKNVDFLVFLEMRIRQNIEVEYFTVLQGQRLVALCPRVGRGYMIRKRFIATATIVRREQFARSIIEESESILLNPTNVMAELMLYKRQSQETDARKRLLASEIAARQVTMADFSFTVEEYGHRMACRRDEAAGRSTLMSTIERIRLIHVEYETRLSAVADAFYALLRVAVFGEEASSYEVHMRFHRREFQIAMLKSIGFALAVTERQEHLGRSRVSDQEGRNLLELVSEDLGRGDVVQEETAAIRVLERTFENVFSVLMALRQTQTAEAEHRAEIQFDFFTGLLIFLQQRHEAGSSNVASAEAQCRHSTERESLCDRVCVAHYRSATVDFFHRQRTWVEQMAADTSGHLERQAHHAFHTDVEAAFERQLARLVTSWVANVCHPDFLPRRQVRHLEAVAWFQLSSDHDREIHIAVPSAVGARQLFRTCDQERLFVEERASRCHISGIAGAELSHVISVEVPQTIVEPLGATLYRQLVALQLHMWCDVEALERAAIIQRCPFPGELAPLQREEICARDSLRADLRVGYIALFLLWQHTQYRRQMESAAASVFQSHSMKHHYERIRRLHSGECLALLQRAGRGVWDRKQMGISLSRRQWAVRRLQRVLRGFGKRWQLSFAESEGVEHCFLFAAEVTSRRQLTDAEYNEGERLFWYLKLTGARFLRSHLNRRRVEGRHEPSAARGATRSPPEADRPSTASDERRRISVPQPPPPTRPSSGYVRGSQSKVPGSASSSRTTPRPTSAQSSGAATSSIQGKGLQPSPPVRTRPSTGTTRPTAPTSSRDANDLITRSEARPAATAPGTFVVQQPAYATPPQPGTTMSPAVGMPMSVDFNDSTPTVVVPTTVRSPASPLLVSELYDGDDDFIARDDDGVIDRGGRSPPVAGAPTVRMTSREENRSAAHAGSGANNHRTSFSRCGWKSSSLYERPAWTSMALHVTLVKPPVIPLTPRPRMQDM